MIDFAAFRTVIFDLDGVLIDSEGLHERVNRQVFEAAGLAMTEAALAGMTGRATPDAFAFALRQIGADEAMAGALIEEKWARFDRLRETDLAPIPGAVGFVAAMAARYGRLGLVTSSGRSYQRFVFERFGLAPHFAVVITADDITHTKPHPEPYRVACERLGVSPGDVLVFEDSLPGVRSAVAAGCTVVGLTTSFDAEALRSAGAHRTIDGYDRLLRESSAVNRPP